MKDFFAKSCLWITVLCASLTCFGQNEFQGEAHYISKIYEDESEVDKTGKSAISQSDSQLLKERLALLNQKSSVLEFGKLQSNYNENTILNAPKENFKPISVSSSEEITIYILKDFENKMVYEKVELLGKNFLVKDSLKNYNWKLENEVKTIGEYICYKATAEITIQQTLNRPNQRSANSADSLKTKVATNFLNRTIKTGKYITAWYAPEIPVPNGPEQYWGLPGLILEVFDEKLQILCTKIVLNSQKKSKIKMPKPSQAIWRSEFEVIMKAKIQESLNYD